MTDTYQNLLATVLACPEEDGPRLIYADWLEEQGDGARAEFVRVQCELAEHGGRGIHGTLAYEEWETLRQRERELLAPNWQDWCDVYNATVCLNYHPENTNPVGVGFSRGFVSEIRCTLAMWVGGPCWTCNGRGKKAFLIGAFGPFPEGCPRCKETPGTLPGIGPALVRQQPVEVVRASDVRPWNAGNHRWGWTNDCNDFPEVPWHIPGQVFKLLALDKGRLPQQGRRWYPTEQAAQAALSTALLRWAVRQSPALLTGVV